MKVLIIPTVTGYASLQASRFPPTLSNIKAMSANTLIKIEATDSTSLFVVCQYLRLIIF